MTSKIILRALTIQNQLTGLYMTGTLTLNGFIQSNLAKLLQYKVQCKFQICFYLRINRVS